MADHASRTVDQFARQGRRLQSLVRRLGSRTRETNFGKAIRRPLSVIHFNALAVGECARGKTTLRNP